MMVQRTHTGAATSECHTLRTQKNICFNLYTVKSRDIVEPRLSQQKCVEILGPSRTCADHHSPLVCQCDVVDITTRDMNRYHEYIHHIGLISF